MHEVSEMNVAPKVTSHQHEQLLDTIDRIRAQGISRYIDIPQIVVCGDQSSGKSSVLEAVCGLRFEVGDGLCTRFATEYILRRSDDVSAVISIIPDTERPDNEQETLSTWKPTTTSLDEFSTIMAQAADEMGIGSSGKTFSHDRLRIEVSGPDKPHLTLVDVPGLFHSRGKGQAESDKDAVFSLVESYIKNPRSIIMAVISAKNDKENQIVISFAQQWDPKGERTIGVITKPDTLPKNSPSEEQFYTLAQNKDPSTQFKLKWAIVRNRSYEERDASPAQRDETERAFFNEGIWRTLDASIKGVSALRVRLGRVLQDHILAEMPNMLKDVDAGIIDCERKLAALGTSRATPEDQRLYLLGASARYGALMSASNDGTYSDDFFESGVSEADFQKRICAVADAILGRFRNNIDRYGHAVKTVTKLPDDYKPVVGRPVLMLESEFYKSVQRTMERNKGRELPGLFNPNIIKPLFIEHSRPWRNIVMRSLNELLEAARITIRLVLEHVADETTVEGILADIVNPLFEMVEKNLKDKAEEFLKPYNGWPATYNHYFTDNVQKMREDQLVEKLDAVLLAFFNKDPRNSDFEARYVHTEFDVRTLRDALKPKNTEKDMKLFAAIEAANAMLAYYKVALKRIIDNFAIETINEYLLEKLPGLFTPEMVHKLPQSAIQSVAGESESSLEERKNLEKKLVALKEAQKIGMRMHRVKEHDSKSRQELLLTPPESDDDEDKEEAGVEYENE